MGPRANRSCKRARTSPPPKRRGHTVYLASRPALWARWFARCPNPVRRLLPGPADERGFCRRHPAMEAQPSRVRGRWPLPRSDGDRPGWSQRRRGLRSSSPRRRHRDVPERRLRGRARLLRRRHVVPARFAGLGGLQSGAAGARPAARAARARPAMGAGRRASSAAGVSTGCRRTAARPAGRHGTPTCPEPPAGVVSGRRPRPSGDRACCAAPAAQEGPTGAIRARAQTAREGPSQGQSCSRARGAVGAPLARPFARQRHANVIRVAEGRRKGASSVGGQGGEARGHGALLGVPGGEAARVRAPSAAPATDTTRATDAATRATSASIQRAASSRLPAAPSARLATPIARRAEASILPAAVPARTTAAFTRLVDASIRPGAATTRSTAAFTRRAAPSSRYAEAPARTIASPSRVKSTVARDDAASGRREAEAGEPFSLPTRVNGAPSNQNDDAREQNDEAREDNREAGEDDEEAGQDDGGAGEDDGEVGEDDEEASEDDGDGGKPKDNRGDCIAAARDHDDTAMTIQCRFRTDDESMAGVSSSARWRDRWPRWSGGRTLPA
jgi:hypothetical protein